MVAMAERLEKTAEKNIFYKREKDVYVVTLDFGFINGKRVKKRETANTFREAKIIKRQHEQARAQGVSKLSGLYSSVTMAEAMDDYVAHNLTLWSASYVTRQRIHKHRVEKWLEDIGQKDKVIKDVTAIDIENLYQWSMSDHEGSLAIGYNTLTKLHSFLNGLFLFCLKDFSRYGVTVSPVPSAEIPAQKTRYEAQSLTVDELNRLIKFAVLWEIDEHCGAPLVLLVLGAMCGLRKGEIAGVKWSDIEGNRIHIVRQRQIVQDKETGEWKEQISVPKGGNNSGLSPFDRKERWSALPDVGMELLQMVRKSQEKIVGKVDDDAFIYQDKASLVTGRNPYPKNITKRWQQFLTRYNRMHDDKVAVVRLHDLRHTHATILENHVSDVFIAFNLGHTIPGLGATKRYLHDDGVKGRKEICDYFNQIINIK